MTGSEEHLEKALEEYNDRVNSLESSGPAEELLEALVNRSIILDLMGYTTSSVSDLEDAMDIVSEMTASGKVPDTGTFVKIYERHGALFYSSDPETMADDYECIVPKLRELTPESRHYDYRSIVEMCIGCAMDLEDSGYEKRMQPFLSKGLEILGDAEDGWSLNRRCEILTSMGCLYQGSGYGDRARICFDRAIDAAERLHSQGWMEPDTAVDYVHSHIYRGDIEDLAGDQTSAVKDYETALNLTETLGVCSGPEDMETIADLHRTLGSLLMKMGEIGRAETHLLKAMKMQIPNLDIAIRNIGADRDH